MKNNIIKPKKFNFESIKGISSKQLNEHYILYENYVKIFNEINIILSRQNTLSVGAVYSDVRSLALGETFSLNGIKLHEYYFENMGVYLSEPFGLIEWWILKDYGSFESFKNQFTETALSVRGWAILSYDSIDNSLHIIGQDSHDSGSIWNSSPLLVLDVYEHAYMIDFGIDKKKYITTFFENINWKIVNQRANDARMIYTI